MSFLSWPRLIFSGDFQCDVSTVNNDVRHFDNASFEQQFQELQRGPVLNGWWNPVGTGAFGLIGCTVQRVVYGDGSIVGDPTKDSVVGLAIEGADARVSAKLVDLDPQWQNSSEIWGLKLRLAQADGTALLAADFATSPFRDLLFGRLSAVGGDGSASANFTSVLTDLVWARQLHGSRFLHQLSAVGKNGGLSIRLTTFGYFDHFGQPRFGVGKVVGAIGPALPGEPRTFLLGRRFAPAEVGATPEGMAFFDGAVDAAGKRVSLDLANIMPLADSFGTLVDLGPLELVVLRTPDHPDGTPGVRQGQILASDALVSLGPIDYRTKGWLLRTAGIVDFTVDDATMALVRERPLAIVAPGPGGARVVIRETFGGLLVRADDFAHRVDSKSDGAVAIGSRLFAARYGLPLANAEVDCALVPPQDGVGGGSPSDPHPPKAPIPTIGTPPAAVAVPDSIHTDPNGQAVLTVQVSNPNNPRKYLDGQIYLVSYDLPAQPSSEQNSDYVVLHVRDAFPAPAAPTWVDDIQPMFQRYGNLYPIMSQRLVDLGDYDAVREHRGLLEFAFSRDFADPNYMPVTRDLSAGKQAMILAWLRAKDAQGNYTLARGPRDGAAPRPAAKGPPPAAAAPAAVATDAGPGGKIRFMRSFTRSLARVRRRPDDAGGTR